MRLLTPWQEWWDRGREENKFHCDLILEEGEFIVIIASGARDPLTGCLTGRMEVQAIGPPPGQYTKVHLAVSWEHRDSLFVEEGNEVGRDEMERQEKIGGRRLDEGGSGQ